MRRLLIGFILLFAITVQAQERRVEDWMVWLYLPDTGTLRFEGFYTEQGETVSYVPVSFERNLQLPENTRTLPETVIVSDDASTLAYALLLDDALGSLRFTNIIVSEIFQQGIYVLEIRTPEIDKVSLTFHTSADIEASGHALYGVQQRIPAFAPQDPDRERIIAYAYPNISEIWRLEVFDVNTEQVLYQFDEGTIPELASDSVTLHRYYDDVLLFSTINDGVEHLYELSTTDSSIREVPLELLITDTTDYVAKTGESLEIDGDSLLYRPTLDARGEEIFSGEGISFPRFVQRNERIAFTQSNNLSLIERDGTILVSDIPAANLTQLVAVPTGFVYSLETEVFSTVNYYQTFDGDFSTEPIVIWGNYEGETPVEIIYVHHGEE